MPKRKVIVEVDFHDDKSATSKISNGIFFTCVTGLFG
uniref:Uncharacterized protein n=1 Tax=Candidatus Methanophaga sp. ANME-1 ERB7 TaxID=2759913 RepID=A0A7G9ZCR6_9EURY|nr:hypothetical protein BLAHKPKO_00014 [Methanosarcinales archaeon ANME-1 ERB7]